MNTIPVNPFLRLVLLGDAIASGATGLLMFAGAAPLAGLLELPEVVLRGAGLVLLPYAVAVAIIGLRRTAPRFALWAIIAINALWVVESFALLASGWIAPNSLGTAFVVFQAIVVAGFAAAQAIGLRRHLHGAAGIA